MSFHTIQALHYVSFPDVAVPVTMIEKLGLCLATDRGQVQTFLQNNFGTLLGESQALNLLNVNANLIQQYSWVPPDRVQETADWMIQMQIQQSMLLAQSLWLVKDNSVNASEVYFATRKVPGGDTWTHATPPFWFFMADCKLRETSFSATELDEAISFYRASSERSNEAPYNAYRPEVSMASVKSRIGRGLLAVRYARATDDIGIKCAFYCVCLEALLCTDDNAVAHNVAHRTASLVGADADSAAIYSDIKKLYDGRSRVLHGDELDPKLLRKVSERIVKCDEYLRRALRKVLLNPELKQLFDRGDKVELDNHFQTPPPATN